MIRPAQIALLLMGGGMTLYAAAPPRDCVAARIERSPDGDAICHTDPNARTTYSHYYGSSSYHGTSSSGSSSATASSSARGGFGAAGHAAGGSSGA